MALFQNTPNVTRNILILNILVFVGSLVNEDLVVTYLGLYYPLSYHFHFWQPLTYMFVHADFWHIFFNMYSLWLFGSVVERVIGEKKFIFLYLICGLGAAGLHILVQFLMGGSSIPCVGASGAIYGMMIAFAMLFPEQRLTLIFPPVTLKARTMVLVFAGIELLTGLSSVRTFTDGVAHFAHLGGMLIAFLMIMLWRKRGTLFERDQWI